MHLTNYSLNKENVDYIIPDPELIMEPNNATKRTLTSIWKSLEMIGYDSKKLQRDIEDVIIKFLVSMHPYLLYNVRTAFSNEPGKCF